MSRHDIDMIIIKHWMVLHNTCLIMSYLTGGEIRCITLYLFSDIILFMYYLNVWCECEVSLDIFHSHIMYNRVLYPQSTVYTALHCNEKLTFDN